MIAMATKRSAGPNAKRAAQPARSAQRSMGAAVSHPDRIVFPEDGITKRELAEYYVALAPALWPHLQARPLSVLRSVATGRNFFQRHLDGVLAAGFQPVEPGADSSAERPFFAAVQPQALAGLAQMAALELHTWGSRLPRADRADRVTFDIDPDPGLPWSSVCAAARSIRGFLAELGLEAQLKTSGGFGLHVVVPLQGRLPAFAAAAAFAKAVATHFARRQPELFTARRGAANRKGRMYIDWQRNQQGATTVAAYSPRWRKGAPVSTPVAWSELGKPDLRGAHFNLRKALARYRRSGDPWLQQPCRAQSLSAAVQRELERRTA